MKFFSPTSELKELLLLEHIERHPDTTQKEIARVIEAAPSMVNVYIDGLEGKKYLFRDYQSSKMINYIITPEGIKRKNYLSITYFHELLKLYKLAEQNIENFLIGLEEKGYQNILFYGAGEVAQIMLEIINKRHLKSLKVVAVVDDQVDMIGKKVLGYTVISRSEIMSVEHDGIVITSYTFEDEIKDKLNELGYDENKVERFFTVTK